MSRATLRDLVEGFVQQHLGYGNKEFVVSNDVGILYDADEDENLAKKLSELGKCYHLGYGFFRELLLILAAGIQNDSSLTVVDEDDHEPFVNVVINIQEA